MEKTIKKTQKEKLMLKKKRKEGRKREWMKNVDEEDSENEMRR
jgi:hypothetical protein